MCNFYHFPHQCVYYFVLCVYLMQPCTTSARTCSSKLIQPPIKATVTQLQNSFLLRATYAHATGIKICIYISLFNIFFIHGLSLQPATLDRFLLAVFQNLTFQFRKVISPKAHKWIDDKRITSSTQEGQRGAYKMGKFSFISCLCWKVQLFIYIC